MTPFFIGYTFLVKDSGRKEKRGEGTEKRYMNTERTLKLECYNTHKDCSQILCGLEYKYCVVLRGIKCWGPLKVGRTDRVKMMLGTVT